MNPLMSVQEAAKILGLTPIAIKAKIRRGGLHYEIKNTRGCFGHITAKAIFDFQFTPQIIAVQIVKGGTGKTSITNALGVRAALYGARVLCIDLDQQANLTQSFGIDAEAKPVMIDILTKSATLEDSIMEVFPGLDFIPSRLDNAKIDDVITLSKLRHHKLYREMLVPLKQKYDLILIDCPPALGNSVTAAALACDFILCPITPEKFCISGLKIIANEIEGLKEKDDIDIPFKILLNKYDARTFLSEEVENQIIKHSLFSSRKLRTKIRISQEFPNAVAKKESIFDNFKPSTAKEDIDFLTQEILGINA